MLTLKESPQLTSRELNKRCFPDFWGHVIVSSCASAMFFCHAEL